MLVLVFSSHVMAEKGGVKGSSNDDCATIQSGTLLTSDGQVIVPGYDQWGYNYQAHLMVHIVMPTGMQAGVRRTGILNC